jgi:hypothetical protein
VLWPLYPLRLYRRVFKKVRCPRLTVFEIFPGQLTDWFLEIGLGRGDHRNKTSKEIAVVILSGPA